MGWKSPELLVIDSKNTAVNYRSKRKFLCGMRLIINEARLQYLGVEVKFFSLVLIAFRNQASLFSKNPILAITDLLFGHVLIVDSILHHHFPIRITNVFKEGEFWTSRSAAVSGIQSKILGQEIEWDRQRYSKKYTGFVWGLNVKGLSPINKVNQNEIITTNNIPIIRNLKIGLVKNEEKLTYINLENSSLLHGTLVLKDYSISYVDENNSIDTTSWPTNLVCNIQDSLLVVGCARNYQPTIPKAIFFGSSTSWYHFLIEILPRFLNYKAVNYNEYVVVFRGEIPDSIRKILEIIGFNKIHTMFDGDQVNVEALITIQDFRFIKSDSLRDRKLDLVLVRDFLLTLSSNFYGPNLIYLIRSKALFRPMYQRKYFLNKLAKIGFEIVNPEELSLTEQINLFHNAKILVSESGAALTNILLLPKSCKVVEIHPMPNKAGLWGELAALFDIDLAVVYGKPMKIRNFLSGIGAYRINQRRTILMLQKMKQETL
jgi:hypothetical protein